MLVIEVPTKAREQHCNYCMLRDRMAGASLEALSEYYGVTKMAVARRVKKTFVDVQVLVMGEVQGDPESPRVALFKLDDFNRDPQACRMTMLSGVIEQLETAYPNLKKNAHTEESTNGQRT